MYFFLNRNKITLCSGFILCRTHWIRKLSWSHSHGEAHLPCLSFEDSSFLSPSNSSAPSRTCLALLVWAAEYTDCISGVKVQSLNYAWKCIVTWASGREDYMHIRAFHHTQVVSSIPSVLIGCELRSGYASVHICWPTHCHLFVSRWAGPPSIIFSCVLGQ